MLRGRLPPLRHKAMTARFRQACGAEDPVPVDALLPAPAAPGSADDITARNEAGNNVVAGMTVLPEIGPARNIAKEILGECEGTIISLEAALALRLDPDCIPKQGSSTEVDAGPGRGVAAEGVVARRKARGANACAVKRAVEWLLRRQVA